MKVLSALFALLLVISSLLGSVAAVTISEDGIVEKACCDACEYQPGSDATEFIECTCDCDDCPYYALLREKLGGEEVQEEEMDLFWIYIALPIVAAATVVVLIVVKRIKIDEEKAK